MSANRRLWIMVGAIALSITGLLGIFFLVYLYVDEEKAVPVLQILVGGFMLGVFLWRRRHPPPDARLVGRSPEELTPDELGKAQALNQRGGYLVALLGTLFLFEGVGATFGVSKWILAAVATVMAVLLIGYVLYQLGDYMRLMWHIQRRRR